MSKLEIPPGVTDRRPGGPQAARAAKPAASQDGGAEDTIAVKAPSEGETVNVRIEKAEGGHIVNVDRHDRNYRNESSKTRVVTGDPTIVVDTEE